MPQLNLEIPHALGQVLAIERLKERFSLAKATYKSQIVDLTEEWTGNTLTFAFRVIGMSVSGSLVVEDAAVKIHAKLPVAALVFKGLIEKQLREELHKLLS